MNFDIKEWLHSSNLDKYYDGFLMQNKSTFEEVILISPKDEGFLDELGFDRKDDYVNRIYQFQRKGGTRNQRMVDHLLFAAMIEARSCERFKVLSENIKDNDLAAFYRELMISEANHYTTFINFAREHATDDDVEKRWEEYLAFEAEIIAQFGKKETVHG